MSELALCDDDKLDEEARAKIKHFETHGPYTFDAALELIVLCSQTFDVQVGEAIVECAEKFTWEEFSRFHYWRHYFNNEEVWKRGTDGWIDNIFDAVWRDMQHVGGKSLHFMNYTMQVNQTQVDCSGNEGDPVPLLPECTSFGCSVEITSVQPMTFDEAHIELERLLEMKIPRWLTRIITRN